MKPIKTISRIFIAFLLFTFNFLLVACDSTEPPPVGVNLKLTEIDKAVKETYLHIANTNNIADGQIILYRNGTITLSFSATVKDTIVTDTNLTENTNYKYEAILKRGKETVEKSNEVVITTLLPTSHEIEWAEYYFGNVDGIIWDVAIIDENNIWAVGEVYFLDSTGQREDYPYNLFQWNGLKWNIQKIPFHDYNPSYSFPQVLNTIYAFSLTSVYVCGNANLLYWNGIKWQQVAYFASGDPFTGQVTSMWGKDENNIYLGGRDGSIYFYRGNNWVKIQETQPSGLILDITGYESLIEKKMKIYAALSSPGFIADRKIFVVKENNSIEEFTWLEDKNVSSIWTNKGYPLFASGDGVHIWENNSWNTIQEISHYYSSDINGTGLNDIFITGVYFMAHYNGIEWKVIESINGGGYRTIEIKDNIIVAVGAVGNKGKIKIGKR